MSSVAAFIVFVIGLSVLIGVFVYGYQTVSTQTCTALTGVQNTSNGYQVIVQCGQTISSVSAGTVSCGISRGDKVTVATTNWFGSHVSGDLTC